MNKQEWLKIAQNVIRAYRTYKHWCKALGRFSRLKSKKGKSIAMRAINFWRGEFYRLSMIERQIRLQAVI